MQKNAFYGVTLTPYIYQYDLDGFPLARAIDIARRMRFHKVKMYKPCSTCLAGQTLNKPNHYFCTNCLLDHYVKNQSLKEFF